MYVTYALTRNLIRSLTADAAPWQIAVGAFLGTLVGFLPLFPLSQGPSILGLALLALAFVINLHLASFFLFLGLGKILSSVLAGPAVLIGNDLDGFCQWAADHPLLYWSHLSHTGYLGLTILGFCFALLFSILMGWLCHWFRTTLRARLMRVVSVGDAAERSWLVRFGCWFFGI